LIDTIVRGRTSRRAISSIVAALALLGVGLDAAFGQGPPQAAQALRPAVGDLAIDTESGSRLPLLRREDMEDEASARIYDALAEAGRAPLNGTIAIALWSPETALALSRIHHYLLAESALGPRLAALLGLITAREMSLAYEWIVHEGAAAQAGLEPVIVDVVRRNAPVTGLSDDDALIITFGRQLFRDRHVDSATFAALVGGLGRQGTFDAIMLLTYYAMAGILQQAVDQRPPATWDAANLPAMAELGTPVGTPSEFVELPPRPPLPPDLHEDSYYRFPLLRRDELDSRGREIFDRLVGADQQAAPRGPVGMTFNSPELAEPVQQLNSALRERVVLGTRLSEIVIATTGREMNSQYQWIVHGAAAERAGAGQEVLSAIRDDRDLAGLDDRDAAAIAFTREVLREGAVRPETFQAAVNLFGRRGTVEIAALIGDYLMVTTIYNALGMRLRPEQTPSLPHRAGAPVGAEWR
jgi:4-carboxymuconolactone decarboxylase